MASSAPVTKTHAQTTFGGETFDWNNYEQYRPKYPRLIYDRIFEFHERNGGKFGNVVDFGCGPGTVFSPLLTRFESVLGSDLNQPQLEAIKSRFPSEFASGRVAVLQGKADEVAEGMEENSVDLVITSEAIHWFSPVDKWFNAVGRILRPGGTVAVIQYSFEELDNTEANTIWQSYLLRTLSRPRDPLPSSTATATPRPKPINGGGQAMMTSLLLNVQVPTNFFTQETRYISKTPLFGSSAFANNNLEWEDLTGKEATVINDEKVILEVDRTPVEMVKSLETLGNMVEVEKKFDGGKEMNESLEALQRIYGKDGVMKVRWPVTLLLASKK